jgi:hypothetical protein
MNNNKGSKLFRKETGNNKLTRPYRRKIKEYRYGIVCAECDFDAIVVTYATFCPKYCCSTCRRNANRKRARDRARQMSASIQLSQSINQLIN